MIASSPSMRCSLASRHHWVYHQMLHDMWIYCQQYYGTYGTSQRTLTAACRVSQRSCSKTSQTMTQALIRQPNTRSRPQMCKVRLYLRACIAVLMEMQLWLRATLLTFLTAPVLTNQCIHFDAGTIGGGGSSLGGATVGGYGDSGAGTHRYSC